MTAAPAIMRASAAPNPTPTAKAIDGGPVWTIAGPVITGAATAAAGAAAASGAAAAAAAASADTPTTEMGAPVAESTSALGPSVQILSGISIGGAGKTTTHAGSADGSVGAEHPALPTRVSLELETIAAAVFTVRVATEGVEVSAKGVELGTAKTTLSASRDAAGWQVGVVAAPKTKESPF